MQKNKSSRFIVGLILFLTFMLLGSTALAANGSQYQQYAQTLAPLGVFVGTESGFELDRKPTRVEGVVMLVRLLGAEQEAKTMASSQTPFTDVPDWAKGYVAYAYAKNLSKGTETTLFGTEDTMDARMFTTFLLRSLGYSDSKGDFSYETSVDFAKNLELIQTQQYNEIRQGNFFRGQVAKLSYDSLNFYYKDTNTMLINKLVSDGKLDSAKAKTFLATTIKPVEDTTKTTEDLAKNTNQTVMIAATVPEGTSQGSGVILDSSGTIITNYHVIEGATKIAVKFNDGSIYQDAVYVQDYNKDLDLAVIKINKSGLTPATIGDSSKLKVGEKVVAIGSPYGYFNTVSEGIVSAILPDSIQTTAAISHGSSGGALFNSKGELIGITSAGVDEGQNLGFAIPSNQISKLSGKKMLSLSAFSGTTATTKPTTPTTGSKYYPNSKIPDFGYIYGYDQAIEPTIEDDFIMYGYEDTYQEDMDNYVNLLNSYGYKYNSYLSSIFSDTINSDLNFQYDLDASVYVKNDGTFVATMSTSLYGITVFMIAFEI